ncbi:MAG: hypothetical protein KAW13_05650 [Dehalococcoidia bacterium]|nr:hypothetical protein [Dehalococcoidia bacterium]
MIDWLIEHTPNFLVDFLDKRSKRRRERRELKDRLWRDELNAFLDIVMHLPPGTRLPKEQEKRFNKLSDKLDKEARQLWR